MSNHAELFNGLLEAGKALEELPKVREELEMAKADLKAADELMAQQENSIKDRDAGIAQLRALLSAREAELASTTFRSEEAARTLASLRSILGIVPVSPVAEPMDHMPVATEGGSEPKAETASIDIVAGSTYEPVPGPLPSADSQVTTYGEGTAAGCPGYDLATPSAYGVVSETGTFIPHDPVPEVAKSEPEVAQEFTVDPLPFIDRPHWQKPSSMTWGEWHGKGGLVPSWYDPTLDEYRVN
jgi:hypothetical protein